MMGKFMTVSASYSRETRQNFGAAVLSAGDTQMACPTSCYCVWSE